MSRPAVSRPAAPAVRALPAAMAGLAVVLAATSLTGVLAGSRWWGYVVGTTAVVVAAGVLVRALRMPPIVVAAGQLAALVGLVTAVFTSSAVLFVLPGPDAAAQLRTMLGEAAHQVQVGVPPVPESAELICLVVVALGLVAIAVDALAVSAAAPAASGLVLLCVVAVPASLSDRLLPWWSFVLGAVGFALLLTVDGQRRHLVWGEPAGPGGHLGAAPTAVAVSAGAALVALLASATVTAVGTQSWSASTGSGRKTSTEIGLNPFTSLRGQLDAGDTVEVFRVRGLEQRAYLRALTLSRFVGQQGWQQGPLDDAVPAGGDQQAVGRLPLPAGVARPVPGPTVRVRIEPINYVDTWLPAFGYPLELQGIGPDWRYDPDAITVFSDRRQRAGPYTELGVLPQPDPQLLRAAGPGGGAPFASVDPRYLDTGGVDPRVSQLAGQVAAGARTAFDATVAINRWFIQPGNGFRYDLQTTPGNSGDALVDFLVTGRRGYCEQFASAMAIMLRTLRVPARVAIGFTPGIPTGGSGAGGDRLITTNDAHAWVEAWFPNAGWLPFDPTPLSDGRTVLPGYLDVGPTPPSGAPLSAQPPLATTTSAPPAVDAASAPPDPPGRDGEHGTGIRLAVAGLLAIAGLAGLTPLAVRESRRRRRLHLVRAGGPEAASGGWEEVLAESADRGVTHPAGETVRAAALRLAREHALDQPGRDGLEVLVGAVERSWYSMAADTSARRDISALDSAARARELSGSVDAVRASLARCSPLTWTARLLPRSVLHRRR